MNFAEIDEHRELTTDEVLGMFDAITECLMDTLGTDETLDALQSKYFTIATEAEEVSEHVRIAMDLHGVTKKQVH